MKRPLIMLILCLMLTFSVITVPASAESAATRVDAYCTVTSDGDCMVNLAVTLRLDAAEERLSFPLPVKADNITCNGSSVSTTKTATAVLADISKFAGGMVGEFRVTFDYVLRDIVAVIPDAEDPLAQPYLQLQLPLLSGFSYPVEQMTFVITLPGNVAYQPDFISTYRQDSFGSDLEYSIQGSMVSGSTKVSLNDHESVSMFMVVPHEMFPSVSTYIRQGNPEVVPMLIFAGLALLYWLLTLRTLPLIRSRNVAPIEGISAGELGCHLTLAGGDLTMMVVNWAQLGYILIHMDGGRVTLHKRMDMGNERSAFEVKVFKMLFGSRRVVDGTSLQYAKLSQKVFTMVPGERSLLKARSGNMKIFRGLLCGSQVFCGICVAMNMTGILALQILLAVILAVVGAISAWLIQEIGYRTHLRGKTRVYIGLMCCLLWLVLGLLCGEILIPGCCVLGQFVMSYFAAYGGRRSDMGRYDAGQILGLRHYLKRIPKADIQRLSKTDPEFFFNMAPYALALGILKPFAKQFGSKKLEQCPYLMTRVHGRRTAEEWGEMMAQAADILDARYRRMEVEKFSPLRFR